MRAYGVPAHFGETIPIFPKVADTRFVFVALWTRQVVRSFARRAVSQLENRYSICIYLHGQLFSQKKATTYPSVSLNYIAVHRAKRQPIRPANLGADCDDTAS